MKCARGAPREECSNEVLRGRDSRECSITREHGYEGKKGCRDGKRYKISDSYEEKLAQLETRRHRKTHPERQM